MIVNLDRLDEYLSAHTIRIRRPMVDTLTASTALDLSAEKVTALVESGELRWAWDIATAGRRKRTVRILTRSLEEYQTGKRNRFDDEAQEFRAVMHMIFPETVAQPGVVELVSQSTVAEKLTVASSTVALLIKAGEFEIGKKASARCGKNGSPQLTMASVEAFLTRRRIG